MKFLPAVVLLICSSLAAAQNPYLSRVLDFCPAPGQFVNVIPEADTSTSRAEILQRATEQLAGSDNDPAPGMVSLGSFGGSIIFEFDHPVVNVPGQYDFNIFGNAFRALGSTTSGSSEPGIVAVARDINHNGIPDDPWYELAGSEYHNPATIHGYTIIYNRPENLTDPVTWHSPTDGASGTVARNPFHTQPYWPLWQADEPQISFTGTLLPPNGHYENGIFMLDSFEWGYADNLPNSECPGFNIQWAVDADGIPVDLPAIDFIMVYTAEIQADGQIGETSTEICGAIDLHPTAQASLEEISTPPSTVSAIHDLAGRPVPVTNTTSLPAGIYIITTPGGVRKINIR